MDLAEECLALGKKERPEKQWMKKMYDRFRVQNGQIGKAAADELLFRRMYAAEPGKTSDTLKIRYWRTGRHMPVSREQCELFGKALNLSEEEQRFLIQGYYDRCDQVFEAGAAGMVYGKRLELLEKLSREYLDKVHPMVKRQLYHAGVKLDQSLRHLMIFAIPFVNEERISRYLEILGYLSLDENHTQVDGSCLDRLLLGYLRLYEQFCAGSEPEDCCQWFRESSQILDGYLEKRQNTSLRLFYFKALKSWE